MNASARRTYGFERSCIVFVPSTVHIFPTGAHFNATGQTNSVFLGLSLRKSRSYLRAHQLRCLLPGSEQEGTNAKESHDIDPSARYYVTYQSWRDPNWFRLVAKQGGPALPGIRWRDIRNGWNGLFGLPRKELPFRLACSTALLAVLGLLSFSYVRLNSFMQTALETAALGGLDRELHVGRVVRCNPITGIRLLNVALPVSSKYPTAPAVSAASANIYLSGFLRTVFLRKPLKVNLHLEDAEVRVSQRVVEGPNGDPVGQWDPGVYPSDGTEAGMEQSDMESKLRVLNFVQPGEVTIRNARVLLLPADFLDYGHGSEMIEFEKASASVKFPPLKLKQGSIPIECLGDFTAHVKGTAVDGGWIEVDTTLKGEQLAHIKQEDEIVSLRVKGDGVRANRVASFLNLPFRADEGVCGADINMDFLYKSKSLVPLMRGEAQLSTVALRFHPDPKTPEFRQVDGKLRFEGKTLFLDGPTGELGTLPMTIVGNIHLEDGYNLMGYIRPVDVNNILDTFEVEKFVPVTGLVSGEAQLSGALEEPVVTGWAESVGGGGVFDRLPLKSASTTFEWDAIAGLLKFPEINATVKGGGTVSGSGALYFDMTKENEYGIRQQVHSPRSPKALYWNPTEDPSDIQQLSPLPEDELEIDEYAPFRPYDSMRFDFKAVDVNGGDLLDYYGGVYGKMATKAVGLVSGEGVLAGHAKDGNCRVVWRSISPPPAVGLGTSETSSPTSTEKTEIAKEATALANNNDETNKIDNFLGGGDFRGLVYLKLGDLPEARRIKVRTVVSKLDARRCGWGDPTLQKVLSHAPLLEVSADTYFKGVMFQRPLLLPGQVSNPRTPRMELLGADGALAVKKFSLNRVCFDEIMNGSFSFSASDFSMSLKEIDKNQQGARIDSKPSERQSSSTENFDDESAKDELTIAASLKGQGHFCFRQRESELVASVSKDEQSHQIATLFARGINVQDFVGTDTTFSNVETLSGTVNADMNIDLTSRVGEGTIAIAKPQIGPLNFSAVKGKVVWRDQDLFLESGTVKYRRSEYHIDAHYSYENVDGPEFGWEVNVNIPQASIQDVAQLVSSSNAVATALQSPADKIARGRTRPSEGPTWLRRLSHSSGEGDSILVDEWEVPPDLPLEAQLAWFEQFLEEEKSIMRSKRFQGREVSSFKKDRSFAEVSGDLSGKVTVSYNSRVGEKKLGPSNASAVLQAILDQLVRTSFSFQLTGDNWRIGPARVREVNTLGSFEEGVLNLERLALQGSDDFGVDARARISSAGSVKASAFLRQAPAQLLSQYSRMPANVAGVCNARLEVEGNLSNPRAFGRVVWTDAELNGKPVQDAKTDLACINGRCILNADAAIDSHKSNKRQKNDRAAIESLNWGDTVVAGLHDLASQVPTNAESSLPVSRKSGKKGSEEPLQVRISAPVRFYLLNYLRRRAPSSFWSEIEPVLGGSLPTDDEWILMDIDVKKYGLILLNTALPELGWNGGDSDVRLRVSGTLQNPIVKGRVSISDGRVTPMSLSEPLQSIRGEVVFAENGLMSFKSLSGRCSGKTFNLNGDLFLSEEHRNRLEMSSLNNKIVLERLKPHDAQTRRTRRLLIANQKEIDNALQKGSRGVLAEFGEFPINADNMIITKLSGRLRTEGVVTKPIVSGSLTLGNGVVLLANTGNTMRQMIPKNTNIETLQTTTRSGNGTKQRQNLMSNAVFGGSIMQQANSQKGLAEVNTLLEQNFLLRRLQVNIGKGMQVVQPFVLNVDTTGSIVLDGPISKPAITGEIKLLRGTLNVLATRMSILKEERNYIKFVKAAESEQTEKQKVPKPLIKLAMEDKSLLVRIPECTITSWYDNLEVSNKAGDQMDTAAFGQLLDRQLESIRNPEAIQKLLASYVIKSVSVGGKAGAFEWRVYPELVSQTGGFEKGKWQDELGAGATFEYRGLSLSSGVSIGGAHSGTMRLQLWDWLSFETEMDGKKQTSQLKLGIPLKWPGQGDQKDVTEAEMEEMVIDATNGETTRNENTRAPSGQGDDITNEKITQSVKGEELTENVKKSSSVGDSQKDDNDTSKDGG